MLHRILLHITFLAAILSSCTRTEKSPDDNIQREYHTNGVIKKEIPVKDSLIDGIMKEFDREGRLIKSTSFVSGNMDGDAYIYNPANGKPTYKATMKKNIQEGPLLQYYDNGVLFKESTYLQGRVDGQAKTYWPDGKTKAIAFYKKGKPAIGLQEFDKNGLPIKVPAIVVKKTDRLAQNNKVILDLSVSDGSSFDFYMGELEDDRFFGGGNIKIAKEKGKSTLEYQVLPGNSLYREVGIIAKRKTKFGNTLVLYKKYTLDVKN